MLLYVGLAKPARAAGGRRSGAYPEPHGEAVPYGCRKNSKLAVTSIVGIILPISRCNTHQSGEYHSSGKGTPLFISVCLDYVSSVNPARAAGGRRSGAYPEPYGEAVPYDCRKNLKSAVISIVSIVLPISRNNIHQSGKCRTSGKGTSLFISVGCVM